MTPVRTDGEPSAPRARARRPPSSLIANPAMALPLERTLKREVVIDGAPYTVTLSPLGVKLVRKGFRKGRAVSWRALLAQAGDASDGGASDAELDGSDTD